MSELVEGRRKAEVVLAGASDIVYMRECLSMRVYRRMSERRQYNPA